MQKYFYRLAVLFFLSALALNAGACSGNGPGKSSEAIPLVAEGVDDTGDGETGTGEDEEIDTHEIFHGRPGDVVSVNILSPDSVTGQSIASDYDGDGIPNEDEIITNPFVADYPRIVTRIIAPITMEIRKNVNSVSENHIETVSGSDMKQTINNSMEERHYSKENQKTTPYVTKESVANSESTSSSYGYTSKDAGSVSVSFKGGWGAAGGSNSVSWDNERGENQSHADSFSKSAMSEKTVFEDVKYIDNLDRSGREFTDETVRNIASNFRRSEISKDSSSVNSNAGVVKASLFIKNESINIPVRISNIVCTLSFRTPGGSFLPVKTFTLRNEDYTEFENDIYGGEDVGPFSISVENLSTDEVMTALTNGYMPQIHVVSYNMEPVADSNYCPGFKNLKIVEEVAKGRTATIRIVGNSVRELYRVSAFDVKENDEGYLGYNLGNNVTLSYGISLKEALFNILRNRIGGGESFKKDRNGQVLTVPDNNLYWKMTADNENVVLPEEGDPNRYRFNRGPNGDVIEGNSWEFFETYLKAYTDQNNKVHYIETIKRIGSLEKYNPFNQKDNPHYDPNELLSREEMLKMKYWVIYHNGKYFQGDLNDPICPGERYEIVCLDVEDLNKHIESYHYTPLQSVESFTLDTRWNEIANKDDFARSKYLGKVVKNDVIHLEIDLEESRFLFDRFLGADSLKDYVSAESSDSDDDGDGIADAKRWYNFNYSLDGDEKVPEGMPGRFSHAARGGINSIYLNIGNSENARYYSIRVRDEESVIDRTVTVSALELKKQDGNFYISRKTKLSNLSLNSSGSFGYLPPGRYAVEVTAHGTKTGVSVHTASIANGSIDFDNGIFSDAEVEVTSPLGGDRPGDFAYSVSGGKNCAQVRILNSAGNTEFFVIRCKRHLMDDTTVDIPEVIAYPGLTTIDIPNPPAMSSFSGVYSVRVYAVNDGCMIGSAEGNAINESRIVESVTGLRFFSVDYEKYIEQKDENYQPAISSRRFRQDALDLEVNFNDGSGWYRLKLSSDDVSEKSGNVIDCRFTSNIEYDKQKFHVYFTPPAGTGEGIQNVFTGGRDTVDIFIRTVAEEKYRDRFWIKQREKINEFNEERIFIKTPVKYPDNLLTELVDESEFTVNDFSCYWCNYLSTETDVTKFFENYLKFTTSGSSIQISNALQSDFFFSPREYRRMTIKACLSEMKDFSNNIYIEKPTYERIQASNASVTISNIKADNADYFEVYWRPWREHDTVDSLKYEEITRSSWFGPEVVMTKNGKYNCRISGLTPYKKFIVAILGVNRYGISKPRFSGDNFNTETIEFFPVIADATGPSDTSPSFSLNTGGSGSTITVNNVSVDGQCRYQAFCINAESENQSDLSNWEMKDTYRYNDYDSLVSGPATLQFKNLIPGNCYKVKVRSITLNNEPGAISDSQTIELPFEFSIDDAQWYNYFQHLPSTESMVFHVADIRLGDIRFTEIPVQANCSVKVEWLITEDANFPTSQNGYNPVKKRGELNFISLESIREGIIIGENNFTNGAVPSDHFALSCWVNDGSYKVYYLKNVSLQVKITIEGDINKTETFMFNLPDLDVY